jgi:hypothetical protein
MLPFFMVKQEISYERKKTWSMELLLPVAVKQMWFPMALLLLGVALGWNIGDKAALLKAETKALLLLQLSCWRGLKRCNLF